MDFIEIAIVPVIILLAVSTSFVLFCKHRFNIKNPFGIFNIINISIFLVYLGWLWLTPGGGSGAFAMFLFSIFFAPFVLIAFNCFFALINFYDNKRLENKNKFAQVELVSEPPQEEVFKK